MGGEQPHAVLRCLARCGNTHRPGDHHRDRTEEDCMINSKTAVDLFEAMDMLDVTEDVLGKLAEEGKLKSRRADGTVYFLREEIEQIIDRQIDEVRSKG